MGRCKEIYESQINLIKSTKLFDRTQKIFIGISGKKVDFVKKEKKIKIFSHDPVLENGEKKTLLALHKICKRKKLFKLWYIHTKGAQYTDLFKSEFIPFVDSWRNYLEYFVIVNHEECIKKLNSYDICGTEWHQTPEPHFSGNFWWARSDYINKINPFEHGVKGLLENDKNKRHLAELGFIGTKNPLVFNFLQLKTNGEQLYKEMCSPHSYKKTFL